MNHADQNRGSLRLADFFIFGRIFLLAAALVFACKPIFSEDAPPKEPGESELIERQRIMERDLEARIQNVLNKTLGPDQSEVKVSINLSVMKDVKKKSGSGQQKKQKEENPLGDTKFILPGVPAPKNVGKEKEPENVTKQQAEQEREQTQISFKVITSKREAVVFYNEKMKAKEAEAKRAVMALTDLKDEELKFIPGKFFTSVSTYWEEFIKDPKNLIFSALLFLLLLLILWLFIPLTSFFKNYITAMKEKAGIEVKMESSSEDETDANRDGLSPEELAERGLLGEDGKEGEGEMAKKYAPFEYITEENLKRLLGVFRKEPPQVIALVLSYLKQDLVKTIYSELPVDLQVKVAAEASAVRQATEEQVRMVDENIKAKIDFVVGGVDNLIKILEEVDYKIRDNILEYLMNHKPQLYEKVRSSILLFEDFVKFPDPAVQTILRELKTDQLARCLRNASPELLNKFMTNMSQGGAALLKEEMEFGRPVSDDQIEMDRQSVMNSVKQMESDGKVAIREKKKISVFESEDATSPLTPSMPDESGSRRGGKGPGLGLPSAAPAPGAGVSGAAGEAGNEAASYISYGEQLYAEEKFDEALTYLQHGVEQDPNNAAAYQTMGHCYYSLSMPTEALQCYEYALSLAPGDETLRQWVEQFKQSVGA